MVIAKDELLHIINEMPDKIETDDMMDKILLFAKIDQGIAELDKGLGKDWNVFKEEWLKEDQ